MSLTKHPLIFTIVMMLLDGVSPSMGCEMERQSDPFNIGSSTATKCRDSSHTRAMMPRINGYALNAGIHQRRVLLTSENTTSEDATSAPRWWHIRQNRRVVRSNLIRCTTVEGGSCVDSNSSSDQIATLPADIVETEVPLPKISVSDASVLEGDSGKSNLAFTVTLDKLANGYVDATYSTTDGTATTADSDYISSNGTITIAPGFTSTEVIVSVLGDTINELDETFTLTLGTASANVILDRATATGIILTEEFPGQDILGLPEKPRGLISNAAEGRPINQRILEHPNVTGILVLDEWNDIETSEGVFDWNHIDSEVARAKAAGKVVRLAIHAGGDSAPDWIFENYPEVKRVIWYDKMTGELIWIPAFWDPDYIEIKRRFYVAVGERYSDSDTIFAMSASMADPNTGDWSFIIKNEVQEQSFLDAGFTEDAFISAYKKIIDYAMTSYKNKYVVTAVGPLPRQLVSDMYYAVHQVLDYAFATYGERLIIAKGSLHAATPDPLVSSGTLWETMLTYTPNTAAQFVWSVTIDPEYKMNGRVPYSTDQIAEIFRNAVETGKSYDLRWIEPWVIDILNPALQDEIVYAANLFNTD